MPKEASEAFARLFAAHHRRIFGYIRALVPNRADAEEVFQETCVVLWGQFDQYDPKRPFAPWALAVALNQVRSHRHRQRRQRVVFSDALLEQMSSEEGPFAAGLAARAEALDFCLEALPAEGRETLRQFYVGGATAPDLAEQTQQKVNTIYKIIRRLRLRLLECVERRLASENR
jgi:RNA polymerase sigma-70 factor (ECF subfamily)